MICGSHFFVHFVVLAVARWKYLEFEMEGLEGAAQHVVRLTDVTTVGSVTQNWLRDLKFVIWTS
jgi:hypothetical protein